MMQLLGLTGAFYTHRKKDEGSLSGVHLEARSRNRGRQLREKITVDAEITCGVREGGVYILFPNYQKNKMNKEIKQILKNQLALLDVGGLVYDKERRVKETKEVLFPKEDVPYEKSLEGGY